MHTHCVIMADNYQNYTKAPIMSTPNETSFEVSDFFEFNDWIEEDPMFSSMPAGYNDNNNNNNNPQMNQNYMQSDMAVNSSGISNISDLHEGTIIHRDSRIGSKDIKEKVAFKTKSEVEVLDDGFKWRKYGKKMVKNSPNPRLRREKESRTRQRGPTLRCNNLRRHPQPSRSSPYQTGPKVKSTPRWRL
ncbi:probable WRKY transcription factor 50 [Phtheirospermum japonicum]|uniref:Probable WRKY transcription factor 50 n=1 Tax=Phtheirospermum japonicum TaxID=374723 RepID=A0A830CAV8_9LAMI|nr:probable WRKY transcription factor 50 [Phtheirospermum japonicum]